MRTERKYNKKINFSALSFSVFVHKLSSHCMLANIALTTYKLNLLCLSVGVSIKEKYSLRIKKTYDHSGGYNKF